MRESVNQRIENRIGVDQDHGQEIQVDMAVHELFVERPTYVHEVAQETAKRVASRHHDHRLDYVRPSPGDRSILPAWLSPLILGESRHFNFPPDHDRYVAIREEEQTERKHVGPDEIEQSVTLLTDVALPDLGARAIFQDGGGWPVGEVHEETLEDGERDSSDEHPPGKMINKYSDSLLNC